MTELVLNGEIYIRTASDYELQFTESETTKLELNRFIGEWDETDEMANIAKITERLPEIMEYLDDRNLLDRIECFDYIGTFHRILIQGNGIYMISDNEHYDYEDMEEVNHDYIKLDTFLKKASWVGRNLVPKPGTDVVPYKILFEYMDIVLMENMENHRYIAMSTKNEHLQNYTLGDMIEEIYGKKELYQAINKQELLKSKEFGRS